MPFVCVCVGGGGGGHAAKSGFLATKTIIFIAYSCDVGIQYKLDMRNKSWWYRSQQTQLNTCICIFTGGVCFSRYY